MGQDLTPSSFAKEYIEHQTVNYSSLRWAKTQGTNNKKIKLDSIWTKYQAPSTYQERKDYYQYNSKNQFIEAITQELDLNTGKWLNKQKTKFLFDTITNTTTMNHYLGDTLNNWFMNFTSTQQVDTVNHMITEKYWTLLPNKVINYINQIYYNSDGLISVKHIYYHFDSISQTFRMQSKQSYLYNNQLRPIELFTEITDNTINKIVSTTKTIYRYTNDSLLSEQTYYRLDSVSNKWNPTEKNTYKYDSYGNLLEKTSYYFEASTWSEAWKTSYVYDINNNCTFMIIYWNNNLSKLWEPFYKWEQIYDNNYGLEDLNLPKGPMYGTGFGLLNNKHLVSNRKHYIYKYGKWLKEDEHVFYYSRDNTTETINYEGDIRVYPNPASDYIMIEARNCYNNSVLYIYDAIGKLVIQHNLSENKKVPVYFLSRGVYTFSVKTEDTVLTGKFIIMR